MRQIEVLLSGANALTWLILMLPRLRAMPWTGALVLIAMLLALAQVLIEDRRWQMVPAYLLARLFCLLWLLPVIAPGVGFVPNRHFTGSAVGLGVFALALSIFLPLVFPVFHFLAPTGPYPIGTLTYHWRDASRPEIFSADPSDRREVKVQIWYPATDDRAAPRAPYVEHPSVLAPALRLLHLPAFCSGT